MIEALALRNGRIGDARDEFCDGQSLGGPPLVHGPEIYSELLAGAQSEILPKPPKLFKMSDTEMDGGVALDAVSPTHSHLVDEINGGAMDVHANGAASVADSTVSSRLYVACLLCPLLRRC